jgi:hypothetical protein
MRHTVIGLFDTYARAEAARDTLVQTGFARETIELQANPEPSVGSATDEVASSGVLANIERFLSSLFAAGPRAPETARYAEAVRRGAVLVCVNAASESHSELARETLTRLGATDIGERSPDWDTSPESSRDHSVLDELGIGAVMPGTPQSSSAATRGGTTSGVTPPGVVTPEVATFEATTPGAATPEIATFEATTPGVATPEIATFEATTPGMETPEIATPVSTSRPATVPDPLYPAPLMGTDAEPFVPPTLAEPPVLSPVDDPLIAPRADEVGRGAVAAGSLPGSGAIMQPSEVVPEGGQPTAGLSGQMPNEYLEYEEDFRAHYDEQYAAGSERYEDYVPAYRHGAQIGHDPLYRDSPWDDVEPEARRRWETTSPDSAWERFKLAVRHGWERVTGHHHV